jgi:hypothetical protein
MGANYKSAQTNVAKPLFFLERKGPWVQKKTGD